LRKVSLARIKAAMIYLFTIVLIRIIQDRLYTLGRARRSDSVHFTFHVTCPHAHNSVVVFSQPSEKTLWNNLWITRRYFEVRGKFGHYTKKLMIRASTYHALRACNRPIFVVTPHSPAFKAASQKLRKTIPDPDNVWEFWESYAELCLILRRNKISCKEWLQKK